MAAKRLSAVELRFLDAHCQAVCGPKGHEHVGQEEIIACARHLLAVHRPEA